MKEEMEMEMEILKLKIKTKPCFSPHFMNKHTTTRFFHRACTCRARNKKGKRPKGEKCGRKKRKEFEGSRRYKRR